MSNEILAPVELTEAELDVVAAGQNSGLVVVDVHNVLNNNNVQVAIPVAAAVAASVLGGPTGAVATQPGRVFG